MHRKALFAILAFLLVPTLTIGCKSNNQRESISGNYMTEDTIKLSINGYSFNMLLADTKAASELKAMLEKGALKISMRDYGGWEKVGSLGKSLTKSDREMTAEIGDVMLYQGNQIVLFYGESSWSYTPLGRVSDLKDWKKALSGSNITVELSL